MDLKDIKAIIDLMKKQSVTEFEMEKDDFKIKLRRGGAEVTGGEAPAPPPVMPGPVAALPVASQPAAAPAPTPAPAPAPAEVASSSSDPSIDSPMIGTFYRSPSPESASYAEVGAQVDPETVVCIIEAMKVMNEIKAEMKGVITEILVENGKPVEYGQPLFRVKPL